MRIIFNNVHVLVLVIRNQPELEWVSSSGGNFPPNAVQAGYDEDNIIYVARAHHRGDNLPGKLIPELGTCYVPWGGGEHAYQQYEVRY